jgi:hemolysin III
MRQRIRREFDANIRPLLRGWLHLGAFPFAIIGGLVLLVLAPDQTDRITIAIFTFTAGLLFGVSAAYHRGQWSDRVRGVLRRMDHINIALVIAGTYTPITVALLSRNQATILLSVVWGCALALALFRAFWVGAPRWLYVPLYIVMGWVAVAYLPSLWRSGGPLVVILIAVGGLLYSAGAVIYALKRPRLSERFFGFHELFHAFTIAAFITHFAAVALVTI